MPHFFTGRAVAAAIAMAAFLYATSNIFAQQDPGAV